MSTIAQPTIALPCCFAKKHTCALSPKESYSNISDMQKLSHWRNNSGLSGTEYRSTSTVKLYLNLPPGLIPLRNISLQFSVCCQARPGIQESFYLVLAGKSCPSICGLHPLLSASDPVLSHLDCSLQIRKDMRYLQLEHSFSLHAPQLPK